MLTSVWCLYRPVNIHLYVKLINVNHKRIKTYFTNELKSVKRTDMDYSAYVQALVNVLGGQHQAAEAIGVSQATVHRWLNGEGIRGKNLDKLLAALKMHSLPLVETTQSVTQLHPDSFKPEFVQGSSLISPSRDLPVYASAMGGDGHQIITFDAIDWVKRPSVLDNVKGGYAIYIVGESMVPAFRPGDLALVNPHLPVQRDTDVVLFHVPPADEAECIIKRLVGYNDRDWKLEQYNPPKNFPEARASWPICHRVVGKYSSR